MNRILVSLLLAASVLPLAQTSASACSCVAASPKEYARSADVVFTGVARGVTETDSERITRFRLRVLYKGRARRHTDIHSGVQESACGVRFGEGQKYTVFASRSDGELWTNLCSGNQRGRIRHARYGLPRGRHF
jgi:hypothetical protein